MAQVQDKHSSDRTSSDEGSVFGTDDEQDSTTKKKPSRQYEKDSEEEDLERLVLGNKSSFRDHLFDDYDEEYDIDRNEVDILQTQPGGLEDVQDADLFMLDTGSAGLTKVVTDGKGLQGDAPAWEDSDDERLIISLADHSRLRKLRETEAEDIVTGAEYSRRLRQQFLRLHPVPKWATESEGRAAKRRRSSASSDSSDQSGSDSDAELSAPPMEEFLRDVRMLAGGGGAAMQKKKRLLRPEVIDIQRTREIPDQHGGPVESLSFHPRFPVLLSCSTASILYLHHIAPEARPTPNPQLTAVQVKHVDTRRAEFLYPEGEKIFFAGRRRYFHNWDLQSGTVQKTTRVLGHKKEHKTMEHFRLSPCGRYMGVIASVRKGGGIVNVLSTGSMQWVCAARLSSRHGVADFAWWANGDGMSILGKDGSVGEYSTVSRSFVGVWHDEGCIGGIVLSLGGHQGPQALGEDRWVAVGSNSGITNIYDRNELLVRSGGGNNNSNSELTVKERPSPARTFEQLVTPITTLAFSPDGQLFAFASRHRKDALKLVHLPTCTVFRNWPTEQTPLGRITAVAFGKDSDLLTVGNDVGKIRLWEIRS